MSDEVIFQIIVYLVSALGTITTVLWRIKELEKKVEKHNCLVERMIVVEQSLKFIQKQINGLDNQPEGEE